MCWWNNYSVQRQIGHSYRVEELKGYDYCVGLHYYCVYTTKGQLLLCGAERGALSVWHYFLGGDYSYEGTRATAGTVLGAATEWNS